MNLSGAGPKLLTISVLSCDPPLTAPTQKDIEVCKYKIPDLSREQKQIEKEKSYCCK